MNVVFLFCTKKGKKSEMFCKIGLSQYSGIKLQQPFYVPHQQGEFAWKSIALFIP